MIIKTMVAHYFWTQWRHP